MSRYFYSIPPQKMEIMSELESELKSWYEAKPLDMHSSFSEDDSVVICGGDGGLNYAINQLVNEQSKIIPQIIYIPCGTGNDFARASSHYAGEAPTEWLQKCIQGKAQTFPLIRCNDRYFINVGSGLNVAEVTSQASTEAKDLMGSLVYYVNGLSKLTDLTSYPCVVSTPDSKQIRNLLGFIISSGIYAGGGVKVKRKTEISQEKFEVLLIGENSSVQLLELLMQLQKEKPNLDDLEVWASDEEQISFKFNEEQKVNLDGESYRSTKMDFKIIPNAVRFMLPDEGSDKE